MAYKKRGTHGIRRFEVQFSLAYKRRGTPWVLLTLELIEKAMAAAEEVYSITAMVGDVMLKLNPVYVTSSFRLGGIIDDGFNLRVRIASYAGFLQALEEADGRVFSVYIEACIPLTDCNKIFERLGETSVIVENADFFFKKRMLGNAIHERIRQLADECYVLRRQGRDNELFHQSRMRLKRLEQHIQRRSLLVEVRVRV